MSYTIDYSTEAKQDLKGFNKSQENQIVKAVRRVAKNPLPQSEGGHGKPLGNRQGRNLTGLLKIKLKKLGIRVVYKLLRLMGHNMVYCLLLLSKGVRHALSPRVEILSFRHMYPTRY